MDKKLSKLKRAAEVEGTRLEEEGPGEGEGRGGG